jgi:hypothetical protein
MKNSHILLVTSMVKDVFTLGLYILNILLSKFLLLARILWSAVLCVIRLVALSLIIATETLKHAINSRIIGTSTGGGFMGHTPSWFSKDYTHFCAKRRSKLDLGYVYTKKKTELESPKLLPRLLLLKECNIKKGVKK